MWAAHWADSSARMRSISFFSRAASSRSSLLAFTTPMGSMKKVEPEEDTSWTRPGMEFLNSDFTGTTYRSERMVMMDSWRYLDWLEEMIFCKISRTLASVERMCRRMEASSLLAESASSSSPTMELVMVSSKKRLGVRARNRWEMGVFSSVSPYSLAVRAHRRTAAISSSSRVFRLPPMSARWRLAPTGFTPEKPGLPRWMSMFTAAVVSSRARCTSSGSVMGRRARERSFPSWVAAQAASCSRTRGSSSVTMDFSNRSVIACLSPVFPI